jgi:mannose-6-phosphate isomerase-like protein (cupin superfamily)
MAVVTEEGQLSSVVVEAERARPDALFDVLFDHHDGASRICMIRSKPRSSDFRIGLHRHRGDEIWRVRRGRVRIVVDNQRLECAAGELVVVPPGVIHGVAVLEPDSEYEVIAELGMGEWITVIDSEGNRREVEVHAPLFPWHRPAPEGVSPTTLDEMRAMFESTLHLL